MPFVIYLSLYTWNWRTGYLDRLTESTGLEFIGWVLAPGKWIQESTLLLWNRYVYLVDLQEENETLRERVDRLKIEIMRLDHEARQAERLRRLIGLNPPERWDLQGARVIAHRLGPNAVLRTLLIDKGSLDTVGPDIPILTPEGLVGRVIRSSHNFSTVLLLTDHNSRISVQSRSRRTPGILKGNGPDRPLEMLYVPLNDALEEGDVLITSGLAGIFPKGIPIARITRIVRSNISLFQQVWAEPLVESKMLEEVLLLKRDPSVPKVESEDLFLRGR